MATQHSTTSRHLRPSQIKSGMQLQSDVTDRSGRVLLRSGSTLEEKHIRIFQTWGVLQVEVAGDDDTAPANITEKECLEAFMEAATALAERRFSKTDKDHPAIKELFQLSVHHLARELAKEGGHGR